MSDCSLIKKNCERGCGAILNKKEFEEWFLNYKPDVLRENKELNKIKTQIDKQKSKKSKKSASKSANKSKKSKSKYFFNIFGKKLNKTKKNY